MPTCYNFPMTKKTNDRVLRFFTSLLFTLTLFSVTGKKDAVSTSAWSGSQTSTMGSYYNSVSASASGTSLASTLKGIISSPSPNVSYDWGRYEAADEAEGDSTSVLLIYSRKVVKKNAHVSGSTGWNREHSYPQSKISGAAKSDNHQIFADDNKTNNTRGNNPFGEVAMTSANRVKDGYGNLTDNYTSGGYFMPNPEARGEVARATMYVNVLYGYSVTGNFKSIALMLKWHLENPVTNREIYRNNTVHTLQKNRNPFIDKPEYACRIWGATNSETSALCAANPTEPVNVTGVSVSPNYTEISLQSINKKVQLTASVTPSGATNKNVTWTSLNTSVATVTSSGLVTAVGVGTTTITARSEAVSSVLGSATITVTNNPISVTGVTLNTSSLSLPLNTNQTLIANVEPSGASNQSVTWTSSNPQVASVNRSGQVFANSLGSAVITVTTNQGNYSASATVTVSAPQANQVISGLFYNSVDNNGTGASSPERINNGTEEALGFGGLNVVAETTSTQTYYPRGGGLALGSGSNPGQLGITLNAEFATTKIEVLVNDAGKNGIVTLSGVGGTFTAGTPGDDYSNPSSGTPYLLVFNSPVTAFTISSSLRMAIVEINLYIGGEITPESEAEDWATNFLGLTMDGCNDQSRALLEEAMDIASLSYNNLSPAAQAVLETRSPNASGEAIEHALARYSVIIEGYGFTSFINNVTLTNLSPNYVNTTANPLYFILLGLSLMGVSLLVLKVNKKHP